MCLSVPARIEGICADRPGFAVADVTGTSREINVELLDDVREGDWVLVHVGYALAKLDEAEARTTLRMLGEFAAVSLADET